MNKSNLTLNILEKIRNRFFHSFVLFLFIFLTGLPLSAATLTGSLVEDETWTGTINLTGDVTVPLGITLTIDPGVTVIFPAQADDTGAGNESGFTELLVSGSLIASGSVSSPVTFTSSATTPAKGDWGGIRVTSDGDLTLAHTVIEYSLLGVSYENTGGYGEVHVTDSIVRQSSGIGIHVSVSSATSRTVEIAGNQIHDHDAYGVYLHGGGANTVLTGTVSNNEIYNTGDSGIYLHTDTAARSELTVDSNTVYATQNHGIYGYAVNSSTVFNGTISNNEIRDTTIGLYLHTYNYATSESLTVANNTIHQTTTGINCYTYNRSSMSVRLESNQVYQNSAYGIDIYSYYQYTDTLLQAVLRHNTVTGNGTGIRIRRLQGTVTPELVLNTVTGNTGTGISIQCDGEPVLLHNDIQGNGADGLVLNSDATSHVHYNNIASNSGSYEIINNGTGIVDAGYNWWGDQPTGEMNSGGNPKNISRISDIFDDGSKGGVDYSQWLSALQTLNTTPTSWLLKPADGASFKDSTIIIHGAAVSLPGINRVEVSTDNGQSWQTATGTYLWSYEWTIPADGIYILQSRVIASDSTVEQPSGHHTVTADSSLPTTTGELTSDETWNGEVLLTGDVTVPEGITLTLDPGTTIRFQALSDDQASGSDSSRAELLVSGSLIASGSAGSPITFTSSAITPAKGDWGGIRMTSNGNLTLAHSVIEYGKLGVRYESSGGYGEVHVTDSIIRQSAGIGIYVSVNSATSRAVEIVGNQIHDHDAQGVYLHSGGTNTILNGTVSNNQVYNTGNSGIYLYTDTAAHSEVTANGNTVYATQNHGIYGYAVNTSTVFNGTISNNEIRDTVIGLYLHTYNYAISESLTVANNTIYQTDTGINCFTYNRSSMSLLLESNEVYDNTAYGIDIYSYYQYADTLLQAAVRNNTVTGNETGIRIRRLQGTVTPELVLNTVTGNTTTGISIQCDGEPVLLHNDIQNNGADGLVLESTATSHVHYNNIASNLGSFELTNNGSGIVDGRYNWWGDQTSTEMNSGGNPKNISRIFDIFDDGSKGGVDYSQWLSATQSLSTTPTSWLLDPVDGVSFKGGSITIHGAAVSLAGINRIEVSTDNGQSWQIATGKSLWSYEWATPGDGTYILQSRVIASDSTVEQPSGHHTVTVDSTLPTTTGELIEDETWSGEVLLTGDVTVPAGITLTLDPGTTIRFQSLSDNQSSGSDPSRSELLVSGSLIASGSAGSPVTFTSSSDTPAKGDWGGIRVMSDGVLTLNHTTIEYSLLGVRYESSGGYAEVHLTNNTIRQSSGIGIYVYITSGTARTVEIADNQIHDHDAQGIYLRASETNTVLNGTVSGNEVYNTGNSGIYLYTHATARSELTIDSNTVYATTNHGIYGYAENNYTIFNGTISNNEVRDTTIGLYLYSYGYAVSESLTVTGNTIHQTSTGVNCYTYSRSSMSVLLESNNIYENSAYGIDIYSHYQYTDTLLQAVLRNNTLTGNGDGIRIRRLQGTVIPKLVLNTVTGNTGTGVSIQCDAEPVLLHNNIQSNGGNGLIINSGATAHVHYNNIGSNSGSYEITNNGTGVIDGRYNWWGDQATTEMNGGSNPKNISRIFDIYDDGTKGGVDYSQWFSIAQTLSTAPISWLLDPADGVSLKGGTITIHGAAVSLPGIERVEVSTDNGQTWQTAAGINIWSYKWTTPGDGTYILQSRVIASDSTVEQPSGHHTVTVDSTLPTTTGTMSGDEAWSGEVLLTGDVTVPEGVTLTIDPGTTIRFQALFDDQSSGSDTSRIELLISGALVASGTVGSPITFTSSSDTPAKGDWGGIRVTSDADLILNHTVIEYSLLGVRYESNSGYGEVHITNSIIHQSSGIGIFVFITSGTARTVEIIGNQVHDHNAQGIYLRASGANTVLNGTVSNNEVYNTGNSGVYLYTETAAHSELTVDNNTIYATQNHGIYGYAVNTSTVFNATIRNNEIIDTTTGLYLYAYNYAIFESLTVIGNTIHNNSTGIYCHTYNHSSMSVLLESNNIYENSVYGIDIYSYYQYVDVLLQAVLWNNTITGNGTGIRIRRLQGTVTPELVLNTITGNTTTGVDIQCDGEPVLLHNDIQGNGGDGLVLNSTATSHVHYNNIASNYGSYELVNNGIGVVDGRYNWWGDLATAQMNGGTNPKNISRIFDIFDDGTKGGVDYSQWLSAAQFLSTTPTSWLLDPVDGTSFKGGTITIHGAAVALPGIERVEISTDNGQSWQTATGTSLWSYEWTAPGDGTYVLQSRVIASDSTTEVPSGHHTVTVDSTLPTTTGTLSEDETWSGEVLLTGDVTVPEGVTLTIDPGTTIRFQSMSDDQSSGSDTSRVELLVSGSLIASGSAGSPITFTSSATTPAKGDWGGIRVTSDGDLILAHTVIEYSTLGVRYESSSGNGEVHITDSIVRYSSGIGIFVSVNSGISRTVEIVGNHIYHHDAQGIYLRGSGINTVLTGTVSGNEVYNTGDSGIYLHTDTAARSELTVDSNTVYATQNHGIYGYAVNSSTVFNGTISNNEIRDTTIGLYLHTYNYATSESLTVANNTIHQTSTGINCYTYNRSSMSVRLESNQVYQNSAYGIDIYSYYQYTDTLLQAVIRANIITGNGTGIRIRRLQGTVTPELVLNTVTGNTGIGISIQCDGEPVLLHNDIQGNGAEGLILESTATSHLHYNNIAANSGSYEIINNGTGVVDGRYNWWGDQAFGQMNSGSNPKNISRIFDIFDDSSKGGVDYSQWLSAAQSLSTIPISWLLDPADGTSFKDGIITIHGAAVSLPGIERVEVSTDNGQSWQVASGTSLWSYEWTAPNDGTYIHQSRVISSDSTIEQPSGHHTVTVDSSLPTASGELSEDETWSGEVLLTGDVIVPEGVTLTIEPGTTMRFQSLSDDQSSGSDTSRIELLVSGSLIASGSAGSPITFTSSATTPAKGDWGGIRVTSDGDLILAHTVIEYGSLGVHYESSNGSGGVHITDSTVRQSSGIGIFVSVNSATDRTVEIINNQVHDHDGQGIYLHASGANTVLNGTVSNNEIYNTGDSGIYLHTDTAGRSELTANGNTVYATQNHGIYGYAVNSSTVFNGTISNNEIRDTTIGLYLYTNNYATSESLTVAGNTIHNTNTGINCYTYNRSFMSVLLEGNNVYENSDYGIDIYSYYQYVDVLLRAVLWNNTITGNGTGIRIRRLQGTVTPELVLNTITGNTGTGVSIQCNGEPVLLHNDIQNNGADGLVLESTATSHVHYNNIASNSGSYELSNNGSGVIDGRYNWWGDQATSQMDGGDNPKNISRIFDIFDDGSKGGVDYSQWLSSAQTLNTTPTSWLLTPVDGASFKGSIITIYGAAVSLPGIERVEVSADNGQTWQVATGTSLWSYAWTVPGNDTYVLQSRVIASDSTVEQPSGHHTVTVDIDAMTLSGTLESDETWSGQVVMEGDVIVPAGVTLTIQPGTTIQVPTLTDGGYDGNSSSKSELFINGTLFAEGTVDQPIIFTSTTVGGGQPGDWRGITVTGSLFLRYVDLQHAETAIVYTGSAAGSQLSVRNSSISNCSGHGLDILATNGAQVIATVDDNSLINNNGYGIYARAAQPNTSLQLNFCSNTIANNGDIGLYTHADGSSGSTVITGTICNNTIYNHLTHGILLNTDDGARSELTLDNNQVYQSAKGIVANYDSSDVASTLTVTSNDIHTGQSGLSIHLDTASLAPHIESNEIHGHTGDGLRLSHGGQAGNSLLPQLLNNQAYENDGIGLYLQPTAATAISNNGMFGNGQYDLYNDSAYTIDAGGNWWGVETTNIINSSNNPTNLSVIFDAFDNSEKGEVDYANWLTLYDPPSIPVLDPVTTPTADTIQTLTGTKELDSGIMINGTEVVVPDQQTTWSYDLALAEGNNSLTIRARTASGMVSGAVYAAIVKDTTAPVLYSSAPVDGASVVQPVVRIDVTLLEETTSIDPVASAQGNLVDQYSTEIPGTWSIDHSILTFTPDTPLADGIYTLTITPADLPLGNTGTESISFTVDLSAPTAPGLDPVTSPTSATQVVISGTKDPDTSVWMDDLEIIPLDNTSTWSYTLSLVRGNNSHALYSRDQAGNSGEETSFIIISDQTAPVLTATEPSANSFVATRPDSLSFIFTEELTALDEQATLSSAEIFNSTGSDVTGTWTLEEGSRVRFTPALPFVEEQYFPRITARDQVGNGVEAAFSFTYDATPPATPTLHPVQSPTSFVIQTLSGTKEANSSIRINGQEVIAVNSDTAWSYGITLQEGVNNLSIDSADRAGNLSGSVTATIQYDETAPLSVDNLTVYAAGAGSEALMDWNGYNEAIQGDVEYYRIFVDDSLFTQVGTMQPLATVPAGTFSYTATGLTKNTTYYFAVVAVDNKGNAHTSVTPISAVVTDVQAPEPVTDLRAHNDGTTLTFTWNHSVNTAADLAGYLVTFNGQDPEQLGATTNSRVFNNLNPASAYPCTVVAVDNDGNQSEPISVTGVTVLPNPAGLTAEPQSGYVALAWEGYTTPEHVKFYAVYVSETDFTSVQGMEPRLITTTPMAKVARLTNETTYSFAVTTVNISDGFQADVTSISATPSQDLEGPVFGTIMADDTPLTEGMVFNKATLIRAQASDPISVSRVEFYLDGGRLSTDYLPEDSYYSTLWDVSQVADGVHQLSLKAYDSLGNSSEESFSVSVSLAPPESPVLTTPGSDLITNREQLTISGTSGPGTTIIILNNDIEILSSLQPDYYNNFSAEITLNEGENRLQARGANRSGQSSPSNTITVILDTSLPTEPQSLSATPQAGGEIKLHWRAPAGEEVSGYHVYRANSPFETIAQAQQLTTQPVASTTFTDLTPADSEWYYRVSTVDLAANEGLLSAQASVISDRVDPKALTVTAQPHGNTDGTRIAPGRIDLTVTVSEPLQAAPFISIVPDGGSPYALELTAAAETTFTGVYVLSDSVPSGTTYILFSGRDTAGNRGTEIDAGATLVFDTNGPDVKRLVITPSEPVKNDDQPQITVTIGLTETIKPEEIPTLSYKLSGSGREITTLPTPVKVAPAVGEAEAWQTVFTLPADAGLNEAETLSFFYEGRDDLDNISTKIESVNQFQVYSGELPPLATPAGLQAKPLAGGLVHLSWQPVDGAVDYQLYRRDDSMSDMQLLVRSGNLTEYEDQTPADGLYFYAVASVRDVDGEESLSGQSSPVSVSTDSTIPNAPQNLVLQLVPQGIRLDWQPPGGGENVTYALYRSADSEITSVDGLTPLVRGIDQIMVIDPTPSVTEHCYVITAEDSIGNESLPSNSAYNNFELLPVANIQIVQQGVDAPVLSWQHPSHDTLTGYRLYLAQEDGELPLTPEVLAEPTYTDTGYTGEERQYILKAVDEHGFESLGHSLLLPKVRAELLPDSRLERGLMNRLTYRVKNLGSRDVSNVRLHIDIGGRIHLSESFDISAGDFQLVPVTVGGYDDLPDLADAVVTTTITPNEGEQVELIRQDLVDVFDGMPIVQLGNEEFTRGGSGTVWFRLENSGAEEIEIITAKDNGNADSGSIRYQLLDSDGNVVVTSGFRQGSGSDVVTLANTNVVTRIQPGKSFTCTPTEIQIPSGTPSELTVRLLIDDIYYHHGQEDEVHMNGLAGEFPIVLLDTSYFGEITTVNPTVSIGDEDVIISGRALDRDTDEPLADVPLNLVITLEGFERSALVMTGADGTFSHSFTPLAGESGRYQVRVVHPDLLDKPVQAEFIITRVIVVPETVNLSIPRSYEQRFAPEVTTGSGTELTNLRLLYQAEDQPGGELPPGVHLTPGDPIATVGEDTKVTLPLTLWADNRAADTGQLVLRVISDESGAPGWGTITVNTAFSSAEPVLSFTPNRVETGVVHDDAVTETVTLSNKGLAALEEVRLSITDLTGNPAPSWVKMNISGELGDMEVGESRDVPITFSPGVAIPEGAYQFKLQVESYNYPTTPIYLFAVVNLDGLGDALFKVSDIYTGTLNDQNQQIQGLSGAKITLQNENTLVSQPDRTTDTAGEVAYSDLPAGRYKYRITADNHEEKIGRIIIRPGVTATESAFLDYNLVTVTWEVTEITIEDRYDILLTAIYETDVPAPVVVIEPASLTLPVLKEGMVLNGEFTLTNYGLIRADNLIFRMPASDEHFKYELLAGVPDALEAKQSITIPYRITCLNPLFQEDESGGGCSSYIRCAIEEHEYECANGNKSKGSSRSCWSRTSGECGGEGADGSGSWSYGTAGEGGSSSPAPAPEPISGAKCLGKCDKDCNECSCKFNFEPVGSTVDTLMREYNRDDEDLAVQVKSGKISAHRYFERGGWHWRFNRDNLTFEYDGLGNLKSIKRHNGTYKVSFSDATLYMYMGSVHGVRSHLDLTCIQESNNKSQTAT